MSASLQSVLTESLAAWRHTKHPRFAAIARFATAKLLESSPRPPLPTTSKAADVAAWQHTFEQRDALDVPRLLAAVGTPRSPISTERVTLLATLDDPRIVEGLLALLEAPPFRAGTAQPFFRACAEGLAESGDPRVKAALTELAGRYKGIIETSIGDVIAALLTRVARELDDVKPGPLSAEFERRATQWEALFESEAAATTRAQGNKKQVARSDDEMLAAIYAAPGDDAPRLVFADALTERGDPRGEFISLQVARANGAATPEQQARERELWQDPKRRAGWALPVSMAGEVTFRRGFPAGLALSPREGKKAIGLEALRTIERLFGVRECALKTAISLLQSPRLERAHHVGWLQARHVEALNGLLPWPSVALDFAPDRATLEALRNLTTLELGGPTPEALAGAPRLESLTLHGRAGLGPRLLSSARGLRALTFRQFIDDWAALGPLTVLQKLERLAVRNAPPPSMLEGCHLLELELAFSHDLKIGPLLEATPTVRRLTFSGGFVPDDVIAEVLALARTRPFEALGFGKLRIDRPFAPDGVADVEAGYDLAHSAKSFEDFTPELVQRVRLRPPPTGPTQPAASPPKADVLEALQRACAVPLELHWY